MSNWVTAILQTMSKCPWGRRSLVSSIWMLGMLRIWIVVENEVNAGYRLKNGQKKCCSPFDENEDICVDLEGYTDMKALQHSNAVQLSLSSRKSWIRTTSRTLDPLLLLPFLSSIHDCLLPPFLTMWHIYLFCLKFNWAQMQSQQTNKFSLSQVEVSALFSSKKECFFLLPNCLICDVQGTSVFTSSRTGFETLVFL